MSLDDLYQKIILDHYKNPRGEGEIKKPDARAHDNNPSCGDELELFLKLNAGQIEEVRFKGEGCAISMASASLMTRQLEEKTVEQALDMREKFKNMITSDSSDTDDQSGDELGDLVALKGVIKFPIRVKCASLPWDALRKALE